jgi:DedD protein
MEEKDDLMKNIANDSNNMKKYLIIAGAVFVVFVVGIVIAKFAFGSSKDNTQVILPPEPTSKTQKEAAALFNSINVEKSDDTAQNQKNSEVNNNDNTNNKKVGVEDVLAQKQTNQDEQNDNVDEFKKPEPLTIEPVKPKIEVKKTKPQPTQKNVTSKIIRNYYIQVAALTRGEPSKKFLNLIKQNGFNYKIVEINVKGKKIKRVLVGPFTQKEAKKDLPVVKEKITSSAFIKKLK